MVSLTFLSTWLSIIGVIFLLFGWKTVRALAYPFVVLAFMIPLPPFINNLLTFKIKLLSSYLSAKIMQAAGLSVFLEGNIIDIGVMQLQVVDACSGLRYVFPLLLMGLVVAYLFHKRWWERGIIILITIPISIFANALRIAMTGLLAVITSKETAEGFFHGFSSWLIFIFSLAFLAILSIGLKLTDRIKANGKDAVNNNQGRHCRGEKNKRLRPAFLWIAAIIFVVAWGLHSNLAADQIVQDRKTFEEFPMEMGPWMGEKILLRDEIRDSLWADDYIQIQYRNRVSHMMIILFIPYYEVQGVRNTAHSPVSCLVGSGYAPISRRIIVREMPDFLGTVKIRQMVLEKEGRRLLSNYWFQQRGRWIASEYLNKWYLFWDSITKGRADGALVRIEMPLQQGQEVDAAQTMVDEFTRLLAEVLPEYVPG
jgi:exosortase D (VPLPA-CTERM-specific)